jgi:transcriptional regulator with XRE-family HTH domain
LTAFYFVTSFTLACHTPFVKDKTAASHPSGEGSDTVNGGEKNVSQQELADLISSHSTHISRYERNMAAPSIDVVKKIAEALDVTTDTLIYGTQDEKVKNSLKDNELLNMFIKAQSLTNKQQDTVKDLLSAFLLKSDLQKNLVAAK